MLYLKQSTASQSVLIGPFVDSTDGDTAETGLTIANTDIRLSKNGANMAAKASGGGTHDEAGWYTITLDATDTDTVGRLQVSVKVAGARPVWAAFQVVEEAVYVNMYAASAVGPLTFADILTTAMTESYAANGVAPTLAQAILAIHQKLMQFGISGTALTVRKLDDIATAFAVTLDDASSPTDAKRV